MKSLLFACLLGVSTLSAAAEPFHVGTIHDRDGWSRLHETPDLKSKETMRLKSGQRVLLMGTHGHFHDVLEMRSRTGYFDGSGFLHESRVQVGPEVLGAACVIDKDGWTNLRSGPDNKSRVLRRVPASEYVFVLSKGTWYEVMTVAGERGFIHGSRMEFVVPHS